MRSSTFILIFKATSRMPPLTIGIASTWLWRTIGFCMVVKMVVGVECEILIYGVYHMYVNKSIDSIALGTAIQKPNH